MPPRQGLGPPTLPIPVAHGVVSGRVLFDGKPVDRVVVAIVRGPIFFEPPEVFERRASDGRFRLVNLAPGEATIVVASPGAARAFYLHREIARDAPIDLGDVVLPKGFTIRGTVTNEAGAPVPDAEVSLLQTQFADPLTPAQDLALGNLHAVTDRRGAYSIPAFTVIDERRWATLSVAAHDGRISWTQTVPTDNAVMDVVVSPKATLQGSITIADVKGLTVESASMRRGFLSANLEPDGSFVVEVPSGDCLVVPYTRDWARGASKLVTVPPGSTTTVTLP